MGNHLTPVLSLVNVRALFVVVTTVGEDERSLSVEVAFWIIALDVSYEFGPLKKVKCTHVQALRLCTGRTALRGSRGISLPFHDHGTRRG